MDGFNADVLAEGNDESIVLATIDVLHIRS